MLGRARFQARIDLRHAVAPPGCMSGQVQSAIRIGEPCGQELPSCRPFRAGEANGKSRIQPTDFCCTHRRQRKRVIVSWIRTWQRELRKAEGARAVTVESLPEVRFLAARYAAPCAHGATRTASGYAPMAAGTPGLMISAFVATIAFNAPPSKLR